MKPEEWPIAAPADDPAVASTRSRHPDRLATARADFFLDPAERLSEQERALMAGMLDDLIAALADEITAALPGGLDAIGSAGHAPLMAGLTRAGLLDRPVLIGLLLRRADEYRLESAFRQRPRLARPTLIQRWVADADGDLAGAAMALVVAAGRRRDRFGQPRLLFDDLPAEEAVALAHIVAAGLRTPLPAHPELDRALAAAAEAVLSRHDEGERLEALLAGLVRHLATTDRLDDPLVEEAASGGGLVLLSAILSHRGGIAEAAVWDHLAAGDDGRLALIARMAGLGRATTARLLADLGAALGIAGPAAELARFDALGDAAVDEARAEFRLPIAYRRAREVLRG